MEWYLFSLFIIAFLLFVNYRIYKNVGFPPVLFCGVWFLCILCHFVIVVTDYFPIYTLSPTALLIFVFGCICFSAGGYLAIVVYPKKIYVRDFSVKITSNRFLVANIYLLLIILPYHAYQCYLIATQYMIYGSLFAGLRDAGTNFGVAIGWTSYMIFLSYVVLFFQLLITNKTKKQYFYFYLSILLAVCYSILSTSRTSFLLLGVFFIGIAVIHNRLKATYLFKFFIIFVVIFFVYGTISNKGGNIDNSISKNVSLMTENFLVYFAGGLSAFDQFYTSFKGSQLNGEYTFRLLNQIGNDVGLLSSNSVIDLKQDYARIPFETNVYTLYKIYLKDFGLLYAFICLFIFSFIHSSMFIKAMTKFSLINSFVYCFMLYPLLISFFDDQYILLQTTWIYMLILIFIFKKVIVIIEDDKE